MGIFAVIFLSFLAVLLIYLLLRRLFAIFAEGELRKSRCVRVSEDSVEIYAESGSLEYLLRLAFALPYKIKVYLNEDDEEAAYIAETLARFYDFEIVMLPAWKKR